MKNAGKLLVIVFMAAVMLPFALSLLFPNWASPGVENRALAEFPDLRQLGFTDWTIGFDAFIKDHLPFKGLATRQYSRALIKMFNEAASEHVVTGKEGWLLYNGYPNDNPLADLTGMSTFSDEEQAGILARIDAFEAAHPGVPFVLYVAPNKETVYRELFPDSYVRYFVDQTRVQRLAAYPNGANKLCYNADELRAYKDNYQLYYKYDTHWNQIGAYLGLKSICERISIELPALEDVTIKPSEEPAVRDLAYLLNMSDYFADDITYDVFPYADVSVEAGESESLYDESLAYVRRFSSNAPNGQTLILVGDSFSEVMVNVAARTFSNVIFVRRDTGKAEELHAVLDRLIEENKGCIVVMEMVERGAWWLTYSDFAF